MNYDNYTLLLVDDNPVNVELLGEILSQKGFRVSTAFNGFSAIDIAKETLPDLILLDIAMPAIDGFQVFDMLRKDSATKDIPVMFVTSLNDGDDMQRALDMGAVDYITKPFSADSLIEQVVSHLK